MTLRRAAHFNTNPVSEKARQLVARLSVQATSALYLYTDPSTSKQFYLLTKRTTIKSPYSGESFSAKPEKVTVSGVGKDLKADGGPSVLFEYTDPNTNESFWLTEKLRTVRSPFTGKSFTSKPEKDTMTDLSQTLKGDE